MLVTFPVEGTGRPNFEPRLLLYNANSANLQVELYWKSAISLFQRNFANSSQGDSLAVFFICAAFWKIRFRWKPPFSLSFLQRTETNFRIDRKLFLYLGNLSRSLFRKSIRIFGKFFLRLSMKSLISLIWIFFNIYSFLNECVYNDDKNEI